MESRVQLVDALNRLSISSLVSVGRERAICRTRAEIFQLSLTRKRFLEIRRTWEGRVRNGGSLETPHLSPARTIAATRLRLLQTRRLEIVWTVDKRSFT